MNDDISPGSEAESAVTASEDGYFFGYLFAPTLNTQGYIKATITRGSTVITRVGCSVDNSSSASIPYNSFTWPAKTGDKMTFDRVVQGTVEGGAGFEKTGAH